MCDVIRADVSLTLAIAEGELLAILSNASQRLEDQRGVLKGSVELPAFLRKTPASPSLSEGHEPPSLPAKPPPSPSLSADFAGVLPDPSPAGRYFGGGSPGHVDFNDSKVMERSLTDIGLTSGRRSIPEIASQDGGAEEELTLVLDGVAAMHLTVTPASTPSPTTHDLVFPSDSSQSSPGSLSPAKTTPRVCNGRLPSSDEEEYAISYV